MATSFWASLVILIAVGTIVMLAVRRSIWTELEIVTGIVMGLLWVYFTVLLVLGVRFNYRDRAVINWPVGRPDDWCEANPADTFTGIFTEAGAEAGVLGAIVGFVIDVLVAIFIAVILGWLLWLGFNAGLALLLPLIWLHQRSLRIALARGRRCRGRWGASAAHGLLAAITSTIWFYTIILAAHKVFDSWGS